MFQIHPDMFRQLVAIFRGLHVCLISYSIIVCASGRCRLWFVRCGQLPWNSMECIIKIYNALDHLLVISHLNRFCHRDVVFTLTAVAVFPSCFRIIRLVTSKCWMYHGFRNVKSEMPHAVLHQKSQLPMLLPGLREYVLHFVLCYICRSEV
jgi:hypothetical protein